MCLPNSYELQCKTVKDAGTVTNIRDLQSSQTANLPIFAKATSGKPPTCTKMSAAHFILTQGNPSPKYQSLLPFLYFFPQGWVGYENARGWVDSREENGQDFPANGQEHGRQTLTRGVYWGLAVCPSFAYPLSMAMLAKVTCWQRGYLLRLLRPAVS